MSQKGRGFESSLGFAWTDTAMYFNYWKYSSIKYWARPCEKTGPKNQWFKQVISEYKSLVRKKLITGLKKLTSGFWDLAKILQKPLVKIKITSGFSWKLS